MLTPPAAALISDVHRQSTSFNLSSTDYRTLASAGYAPFLVTRLGLRAIRHDPTLPREIATAAGANKLRSHGLRARLRDLVEATPEFNERFMLLKGLALDEELYASNGLRACFAADYDVLCNPALSRQAILAELGRIGIVLPKAARLLTTMNARCIWSAPSVGKYKRLDIHFSIRSHPSLREPISAIWRNRRWSDSLAVFIPAREDAHMISIVNLYFDLLNGKFRPRALLDLASFGSKMSSQIPAHWRGAGFDKMALFADYLLEAVSASSLRSCTGRITQRESFMDRAAELRFKRFLFPLLEYAPWRSWLWWTSRLPLWIAAYPQRVRHRLGLSA